MEVRKQCDLSTGLKSRGLFGGEGGITPPFDGGEEGSVRLLLTKNLSSSFTCFFALQGGAGGISFERLCFQFWCSSMLK